MISLKSCEIFSFQNELVKSEEMNEIEVKLLLEYHINDRCVYSLFCQMKVGFLQFTDRTVHLLAFWLLHYNAQYKNKLYKDQ